MKRDAPHILYVNIGVYPAHVGVTCSPRKFARELKRMGVEDRPFLGTDYAAATVHVFYDKGGEMVMIMCLKRDKTKSPEQVAGLVAHEATHVVQELWARIGETTPGQEAEAYLVQNIVQCALQVVWKTGRRRSTAPKEA